MADTTSVASTSFNNTPQAKDDFYTYAQIEQMGTDGVAFLNVMVNDSGGAAKTLFSIDDGDSAEQLLTRDTFTSIDNFSKLGAIIRVNPDGKITYEYGDASFYKALAAGQETEDTFTYAIRLGNGTLSWATVTLKLTGTNDAPTITVVDTVATGSVTEDATSPALSATGTIAFNDIDLIDVHTTSVVNDTANKLNGTLTMGTVSESGTTEAGTVGWTYEVANSATQYLAEGETATESFTVTVSDKHGGAVSQVVTVTVTGTNDAATITAAGTTATGEVTEDATSPALSATGTIAFNDIDLIDVHTTSVANDAANKLNGTLTMGAVSESGTTEAGTVGWTYEVANSATQYLAEGETATESFTVTVSDGHGGAVSQVVTVTVTGTNDVVSITSGEQKGVVTEDAATTTATGSIAFTDVDLKDLHTAAVTVTPATALGTFALAAVNDAANAAGGTVGWTYTVDNAKAQYLAKGETVTETYTVTLDDQNGSTTTQDVVITITGTNDIPVLSGAQATLAAGQEDKPYIVNVDDLLKGYTDIDGDSLSVAGITANHGTVVDNLDGTYTVTPTANYNGSITLHYSVTDSHGGISLAMQSFVLEAVNDPAIITGETRGSVTEAGSGNNGGTATVTGDLQASDVDNPNDAFQPVATATASANHYGSYTVSPAGVWTYTLDNNNATVNALNSGSSLSDSFKVYSQDGTEQVVQITINGANDIVPVVLPSAYVGADDPNDYDNAGPGPGTLAGVGTNKDDLLVGTNSSTGDTISADNGDDTIYGYGGNDTILGENGKDKIYGGAGNDSIEGNNHEDIIYGGSGNDMLLGHSHNDQLYGGSGSDVINGGEGTDTIYGGYGADQLTGGADADTFVFLSTRDTNDTITDFASTIDKIDLSAIDANTGLASSQGFAWGGQQAGAAVLAHSVTYHAVTGGLVVLADTDGDVSSAEFMLTLTGTTALSEGDFKL